MNNNIVELPELLLLNNYGGDYAQYIEAVYEIFKRDFVTNKTKFRGEVLKLKWHPIYQDKAYTFYHITHTGEDEQNRLPDLRRCERMPWTNPTIEKCDTWSLKIWPQQRQGKGGIKDRLCIWLELQNEPDYIVILEVRDNYKLLWTAFAPQYPHEKRKKQKEYEVWLKTQKSPGRNS
ncbi:hypothetical protein [Chitinophaga sp. MM2321]|uniref:hypothetical protein n=1 Tax=Chitinophaga sp. MM2321 TaxID=3137178 RepID=UPI0032D590EA